METVYLIVGLGNPGRAYARTRHNVGFMASERVGKRCRAAWKSQEKFESRLARVEIAERKVLLSQPQTFMNSSGLAVRGLVDYFKIRFDRLLVISDDADLPFGEIRLRASGSSGGHHGLESIEQHLGTREYPRLRIGIGRKADGAREITHYVLGRFAEDEMELLESVLNRVADQIECWVIAGIASAMNKFNGAIKPPMPKES